MTAPSAVIFFVTIRTIKQGASMEPSQLPPVTPDSPAKTPEQPAYAPPVSAHEPTVQLSSDQPEKKKRWWLLPTLLIMLPGIILVASILLYAVANFIFDSVAQSGPIHAERGDSAQSLFGDAVTTNPAKTITNVILFIIGAATVVLGPISFIAGIIILIMRLAQQK